jgi:hypothetical protein
MPENRFEPIMLKPYSIGGYVDISTRPAPRPKSLQRKGLRQLSRANTVPIRKCLPHKALRCPIQGGHATI